MHCRWSSPVQRSLYLARPTVYRAGSLFSQLCLFIVMSMVDFPRQFYGRCSLPNIRCLFILGSRVAVPCWVYGRCTLSGPHSLFLVGSTFPVPYWVCGRWTSSGLRLVAALVAVPRWVTAGGRLWLLYLVGSTVGSRSSVAVPRQVHG